ncbi:hypothetical protein XELAEV_18009275mg [Xenopus laevis]|uniref:Uncharacterized protein n=1 Tax=Xenopus laevis TaxID=8355 RepID=A0A974I0K9_XENLA|nr:hypothetical protein XELAEV_18009275mg [Xenopus laevis]
MPGPILILSPDLLLVGIGGFKCYFDLCPCSSGAKLKKHAMHHFSQHAIVVAVVVIRCKSLCPFNKIQGFALDSV